jgi:hypothetical protein
MITLENIEKYGVNALMFIAIIWLNARLNEVESRLYNCMEKRAEKTTERHVDKIKTYAILPKKQKFMLT